MIKIPSYQVGESSRVYGDFAEKVAFNVSLDPASIVGSIAGGYAATRYYDKSKDQASQKEAENRRIENNTYAQVEAIMRDLKIVFTPINVIYSVNGQVFEIVKADEMNPYMRSAFQKKDAEYFRNLLVNKINMEIQLAEQAFASRLLAAGGYNQQAKQASYAAKQESMTKLAEDEMEGLVKTATTGLSKKLSLSPSFDAIRPFDQSEFFCNPGTFEKVAGIFDVFDRGRSEDVSVSRLVNEINVGFLPDRVVYTWNGQLVEQLTLLSMNKDGYNAFQERDKQFFIDFFKDHTTEKARTLNKEERQMQKEINNDEAPAGRFDTFLEDDRDLTKDAASLEDIVEDLVEEEFPVPERPRIAPFSDPDIHPMAYDALLTNRYGDDWAELEIESLMKQLEIDFELRDGLAENPLNKLSVLHAVSSPDHAMYQASLTFEKFMRAVNSKSVIFEEFQGNLSFEEILFGLEVAKSYDGEEVFLEFNDTLSAYVAEELMNDGVRFVSAQLYDESNPSEKDFFQSVNGYLMRKWKETDAQGVLDETEIDRIHTMAVQITEIADEVLTQYAQHIVLEDPYTSVRRIIHQAGLLEPIDEDARPGVENMAAETIVAHFMAGLFIEYKFQELSYTLEKLEEEGVIRGQ